MINPLLKKYWQSYDIPCWMIIAFGMWCYLFRGFLQGQSGIESDAIAYYEHTRFFLDHLQRGVYPLWDPHWNAGVPNDFFLRRIGVLNPFFVIVIFLQRLGISFHLSYLFYLAVYYFVGLCGFYFLVKRLTGDRLTAFLAYLLLMFSALGTRLFDSYFLLICVPMAWFFYFLITFARLPQRHSLLGMVFSAGLLFTTYMPFHFVTIFLVFALCFCLVYVVELPKIWQRVWPFLSKNKIFTLVCAVLFIIALVPGITFFLQSRQGEMVMPARQATAPVTASALEVDQRLIHGWGLLEELFYAYYYSDLRELRFAVFYVPIFVFILLTLGLITRMTRRTFFYL